MQQLHMLVFSLFLFWISHPVNALETVYGAEGGDIVLMPPLQSPSPPITSIQWKHGEDIVAEWYEVYGTETYCLTKFKGRCKLNLLTGALTITGLTKTDSGICKPEINNKYLDSTHLIVISRVPKPSVSKSCNTEMTACNLTCEGNTIESESVDCKWLLDDAEGPSGKVLTITKEMKEQSYRCVFVNPVGNKTSDIMTNPLLKVETVYGAEGDDIVLTPPLQSPSPPITSIQWKHGEDIIAEWYQGHGNETNCLKFKGRCKLSLLTGALTITGLTKTDSGIYNPEINNKYLDSTHLIVISHVPKPSISKSCNTEMTACNLTCEGNTIESEPVDCKWLLDDAEGPSGKVLTITKEMKEQSYRCIFVNPVGNKTSDIMTNPLLKVETVYGAEGDDIVLTPPLQSPSPPITSIQWKHGEDIIAEWYEVYGNETNCLKFKGRCKLNLLTGALTITGLTKTDSGICKPEINNKYLDSTHLIVISHVPKPSISKSCNTEMTACNLTCEGNTIESEPVDCKWLLDEAEGPSGKVLTITKEMKEQSYRCIFVNPVNNKTSDIMTNPLLKAENVHLVRNRWLTAAAVGVLGLIGVAAYLIYKCRTGSYKSVPTKEEDNNVEVHVPPTTQDSDSLSNGSVIPEEQRASNEPSDSIPLQSVCNGAARGSYGFVPTKEEDNNVIEVHVPPTTQDSDSLSNGSVIPEEQRASNEPSDSIPLQSICNGAGSYKSVPTKEEDNNVIEVHVPPTTQDSDSLSNGSVIPEEQRASNEPSDSIPLQSICNGAGSYKSVPTKEEDNNVIEVHVPPTTQDSDSLCNGSVIPEEQRASNEPSDSIPLQSICNGAVIPEEQRASNEPSDSIPLQNVCNGAGKASEISSNNDLTTSTSPEAGKEADITSEMGPESPQDSITPETGKETEITSDVVEKSDENSTTPASPASSQETGDLATKPPDQEQTNQEPPAAEQEADDAGDLDEH
ncbi:uncharacterized protein [Labrus bergylta]|uniref:uncharacterized protein isoform X6 n=1 Tax=Labrus bergylta TaxID=56723 RepID=UPI003313EFCD